MAYTVDFHTVSTVGLESSPVADALAGLRANEARYFKNKYDHDFTVEPASDAEATIEWVQRILKEERDIVISSRPLQATAFQVENVRIAYVFYESGLSVNVMYTVDGPEKRAVGFKLSDGMDIPADLASSSPATASPGTPAIAVGSTTGAPVTRRGRSSRRRRRAAPGWRGRRG